MVALRVNSDKVQNVGQGQNLDHLHTPLIWTGWGHIVTVPNIFSLRPTYLATGQIIDFALQEQKIHWLTLKIAFQNGTNFLLLD